MDLIEIERHKLIIERCKLLLEIADSIDMINIKNIMTVSEKIIISYENHNFTVVNPSKREIGNFNGNVKLLVYGEFLNKILKDYELNNEYIYDDYQYVCMNCRIYDDENDSESWGVAPEKFCKKCNAEYKIRESKRDVFWKNKKIIEKEFKDACDKTFFDTNFINKWVFLKRKIAKRTNNNIDLQNALKDIMSTNIIDEFQNQNKELLIKYN